MNKEIEDLEKKGITTILDRVLNIRIEIIGIVMMNIEEDRILEIVDQAIQEDKIEEDMTKGEEEVIVIVSIALIAIIATEEMTIKGDIEDLNLDKVSTEEDREINREDIRKILQKEIMREGIAILI